MRLVVINGSPKKGQGTTATIIRVIKEMIEADVEEFSAIDYYHKPDTECDSTIDRILNADVLLIATPLYVDSLPMPLVVFLQSIEKRITKTGRPLLKVYGICHCGFFEAIHNKVALDILRNFCSRTGFDWQYGVSIGAGVFFGGNPDPLNGPAKVIYDALHELCEDIKTESDHKSSNVFVQPSIPRFLYKLGGNMGWRVQAKSNGIAGMLRAKPYADGE
ncbi:MAG TPA: hypothetical protein DDZ89_21460 [Clostridiales bacterium]|nr:hypothetical protein [Clostridiales bacterium]